MYSSVSTYHQSRALSIYSVWTIEMTYVKGRVNMEIQDMKHAIMALDHSQ